jgi:hypothetical protein
MKSLHNVAHDNPTRPPYELSNTAYRRIAYWLEERHYEIRVVYEFNSNVEYRIHQDGPWLAATSEYLDDPDNYDTYELQDRGEELIAEGRVAFYRNGVRL